jgi:hypothetical protein
MINTLFLEFGYLVIGIYLLFGFWDLTFQAQLPPKPNL